METKFKFEFSTDNEEEIKKICDLVSTFRPRINEIPSEEKKEIKKEIEIKKEPIQEQKPQEEIKQEASSELEEDSLDELDDDVFGLSEDY
mgnify:CR=1 FL=1